MLERAWTRERLAALAIAILLSGCADAVPTWQMPDNIKDTRKLLTREEQQQEIAGLSQRKAAREAEMARDAPNAKQAEKPKN
jgi:hypothetical protein